MKQQDPEQTKVSINQSTDRANAYLPLVSLCSTIKAYRHDHSSPTWIGIGVAFVIFIAVAPLLRVQHIRGSNAEALRVQLRHRGRIGLIIRLTAETALTLRVLGDGGRRSRLTRHFLTRLFLLFLRGFFILLFLLFFRVNPFSSGKTLWGKKKNGQNVLQTTNRGGGGQDSWKTWRKMKDEAANRSMRSEIVVSETCDGKEEGKKWGE